MLKVGTNGSDPMVQILGGVLLAAAMVMGVIQMMPERGE